MGQQRVRTRDAALQQAFGEVLRRKRDEAGMSQEALAEKSRMHRNHVSFLERGMECPSLAKVFDLAQALGIAPGDLVAQVDEATKQLYTRESQQDLDA